MFQVCNTPWFKPIKIVSNLTRLLIASSLYHGGQRKNPTVTEKPTPPKYYISPFTVDSPRDLTTRTWQVSFQIACVMVIPKSETVNVDKWIQSNLKVYDTLLENEDYTLTSKYIPRDNKHTSQKYDRLITCMYKNILVTKLSVNVIEGSQDTTTCKIKLQIILPNKSARDQIVDGILPEDFCRHYTDFFCKLIAYDFKQENAPPYERPDIEKFLVSITNVE